MKAFRGFQDKETFTSVPDVFFHELLPHIDNAAELKIVLHALRDFQHVQRSYRGLSTPDFLAASLGLSPAQVKAGVGQAVRDGILLRTGKGPSSRYFLNSPRGRAAARALEAGGIPAGKGTAVGPTERPNLFAVYEQNIGPLTPLISEALKDAEQTYPEEWILDAIELAVKNNKRSWSYCEAILKRWKEEGRGKKQDRRDDQAARQRDVEEKIRKFIRG